MSLSFPQRHSAQLPPQQVPLIIRVKRHRDDEPADTICVVDDSACTPKRKSLKGLSLGEPSAAAAGAEDIGAHVILGRINTVQSTVDTNFRAAYQGISSASTLAVSGGSRVSKSSRSSSSSTQNIILTGHKRRVMCGSSSRGRDSGVDTEETESFVVVDATQLRTTNSINSAKSIRTGVDGDALATTAVPSSSVSGALKSGGSTTESHKASSGTAAVKILSPAARAMDSGIKLALSCGDFSGISEALLKGADANFQQRPADGGYTALMCAAAHGQVRVARRLLLRGGGVDVSLRNTAGDTALDMLLRAQQDATATKMRPAAAGGTASTGSSDNASAVIGVSSPNSGNSNSSSISRARITPAEFIELRLMLQEQLMQCYRQPSAGNYFVEGGDRDDDLFISDEQAAAAAAGDRERAMRRRRRRQQQQRGHGNEPATGDGLRANGVNTGGNGGIDVDNEDIKRTGSSGSSGSSSGNGEYVWDIFSYTPSASASTMAAAGAGTAPRPLNSNSGRNHSHSNSNSNNLGEQDDTTACTDIASASTLMRLDGLKLMDNGTVDVDSALQFAYDSDWSDLAEGEDPDSNDERNELNDYPDEEEDGEDDFEQRMYWRADGDGADYDLFAEQQEEEAQRHHQGGGGGLGVAGRSGHAAAWASSNSSSKTGVPAHFRKGSSGGGDGVDIDNDDYDGGLMGGSGGWPGSDSSSEDGVIASGSAGWPRTDTSTSSSGHYDDSRGAAESSLSPSQRKILLQLREEQSLARAALRRGGAAGAADSTVGTDSGHRRGAGAGAAKGRTSGSTHTKPLPEGFDSRAGARGSGAIEEEDGDEDAAADALFDAEYGAHNPRFENTHQVGKVLRPFVMAPGNLGGGGGGSSRDAITATAPARAAHDTQSLQQLWGEEALDEDELDDDEGHTTEGGYEGAPTGQHAARLNQMRERTGMHFAANPREFDTSTGLAKYGAELSDDDDARDAQYLQDDLEDVYRSIVEADQPYDAAKVAMTASSAAAAAAAAGGRVMGTALYENTAVDSAAPSGAAGALGLNTDGSGELYSNRRRRRNKQTAARSHSARPPADTVAFDPDLDL